MESDELSMDLLEEVGELIGEKRWEAARCVSSAAALAYWKVGAQIREEIGKENPRDHGEEIIRSISGRLSRELGEGFKEKNLQRMVQFHRIFPDEASAASLARHLSWSHFVLLIPLRNEAQRTFYTETCFKEKWSARTLKRQIGGMLYERVTYSLDPADLLERELSALREEEKPSPDLVFRDPHHLDFLGLSAANKDQNLESAVLRELEAFLLGLGVGFTVVARDKWIPLDGLDHYLGRLFYHRSLRRLVAVELTPGEIKAVDKERMARCLEWLETHERMKGEKGPMGMLLYMKESEEGIVLLQLDENGARPVPFTPEFPSEDLLRRKLREAVSAARAGEGETPSE